MTATKLAERPEQISLYDEDRYAWGMLQANLVRSGRFSELDLDNLAEELENLGGSLKMQMENRLRVLIMHLLKWRYQTFRMSGSWRRTIVEQRRRLDRLAQKNPSLRRYPDQVLAETYADARQDCSIETQLPLTTFPEECPFTIEQILAKDFWPLAASNDRHQV